MDTLAHVELEAELLGQLMFDNQLVETVSDILAPTAFAEPCHSRIYSAILSETQRGNLANAVSLKPYFEADEGIKALGGTRYLAELSGMLSVASAYEMARQIESIGKRRNMRDGLTAAAALCNDMAVELPVILDEADTALSLQSKSTIAQPTGADCISELIASIGSKERGVTSGQIPSLDGLLGPVKPKQLVILAARPGMGKTAVALSYGLGAAQKGHGVLFVSLEMSGVELATRMVADLCFDQEAVDMPYSAVRDGTLNATQRDWIGKARDFASELPFQVIDTGSLTMSRLSMLVRSHQRRMAANGHKLELVIVDYLQLLQGDRRASAYERISEVSMGMKALAKDAGVGIMALAQLSRAVEQREDKRPQLSDLRDSGQIEQDADAVLFLLREEYYLRQAEPEDYEKRGQWQVAMAAAKDKIEFILAKRRNGVTGSATGNFFGAYQAVRG